jgi:putative flippase GtrA
MPADLRRLTSRWPSEARRFGLFVVAGGIAAAANYGSRFGFSLWFSYPVAIVLAYLVGMTVAFLLMRQYVFEGGGKALGPQVIKFTLVNVLAVLQTLVVSLVLARWPAAGAGRHRARGGDRACGGVAVPVVTSYFGHKRATFR